MPPALRATDLHLCPVMDGPKPHMVAPMPILPSGCAANVLIGGLPAAQAGKPGSIVCASAPNGIMKGSATVMIGGMPAARMFDPTFHGAPVAVGPGCPTVMIGG